MKIGVLSDTHLRKPDSVLDRILNEIFKDMDMIVHAGDIVAYSVLEVLERRGVLAVCGNMDDYEVAGHAPQVRRIPLGGKTLGLIHGWGSKVGLAQRILAAFVPKPDIIVFGHSHEPFAEEIDGTYLFNPGSAGQSRYGGRSTVGMLSLEGNLIQGSIIPLDD
ncbi:MAG: metallophosphoesterase family protein [Desulfomonilaceae bacterium]